MASVLAEHEVGLLEALPGSGREVLQVADGRGDQDQATAHGPSVVTRPGAGRPARSLVNKYIEEMTLHEHVLPDFPIMQTLTDPLDKASAVRDSRDFVAMWSGQGVGLNRAMPAAQLVGALVDEAAGAMSMFRRRAADL